MPAGTMTAEAPGRAARRSPRAGRRIRIEGYVLVAPTLLVIAVLVLYPAVQSVVSSFLHSSLLSEDHSFVGVANYVSILTDPNFLDAIVNSVEYLVVSTVIALVVGMATALWLRSLGRRWRGLALTVIVFPWAVPGTIAGSLWSLIFNPTRSGLLNAILLHAGAIDRPQIWLQTSAGAPVFIALSFAWGVVPIGAVILLAALEGVPDELYEQAAIDGASSVATFFRITVPLVRPAIAIVLVNASVLALGIFDQVYVLTGFDPGHLSVIGQTYLYAFRDFDFGFAYAASVLTTLATVLVSAVYLRTVYREVTF